MTPDMKELPAELGALVAEIARLNDVVIPGLNRQLTEQFELSTKYVALHDQAVRDVGRYEEALADIGKAAKLAAALCDRDDAAPWVMIEERVNQALNPIPDLDSKEEARG